MALLPAYRPVPACRAALLLLLLSACARQPVPPPVDRAAAWLAHRAQLAGLAQFELRGRIAVQLERDAWSATLHWRQHGDGYTLRVLAPLGRGAFELEGAAAGVTLRTADNRILRAADPEALLREYAGVDLPVAGLRWWIRGLPRPGAPASRLTVDAAGWLAALAQDGWTVDYEERRRHAALLLPAKLRLGNGAVRVRINVNEWRLPP
jgi:outer membrane lipoprotein LolB